MTRKKKCNSKSNSDRSNPVRESTKVHLECHRKLADNPNKRIVIFYF